MSKFMTGNLLLGASILLATVSQVIIKRLVMDLNGGDAQVSRFSLLMAPDKLWRGVLAGSMVVAGFVCWVACLSKLDLSYAYPIACGSALLVTIFCVIFLGEAVTWKVWVGTCLILVGTMFLAPTRPS